MKNFCISLTTIPPRYETIKKTLDSLKNQSKKPDKIFLNIPKNFKRFSKKENDIRYLVNYYENLEIIKCEDLGPGTKLLGSIDKILNYDYVVLVDDDHIYKKDMLQIFYEKGLEDPNKAYSFCVYDVLDCKIGQGADGFMINTKFLKNISKFFNLYIKNNEKLFYNDDLWISIFLNKILKIDIQSLFPMLKNTLFKKNKSIYKKHTQLGALIETYSSNRKKARELRFKESCKEYLILKDATKNFTNF